MPLGPHLTPELVQQIRARRAAAQERRALRRQGISDAPEPVDQLATQPVGTDGQVGDIDVATSAGLEIDEQAGPSASELDAQISAEAAAVM